MGSTKGQRKKYRDGLKRIADALGMTTGELEATCRGDPPPDKSSKEGGKETKEGAPEE